MHTQKQHFDANVESQSRIIYSDVSTKEEPRSWRMSSKPMILFPFCSYAIILEAKLHYN